MQNIQPSGSKNEKSMGVQASDKENKDSEVEDYPLRAPKMRNSKGLRTESRIMREPKNMLKLIVNNNGLFV